MKTYCLFLTITFFFTGVLCTAQNEVDLYACVADSKLLPNTVIIQFEGHKYDSLYLSLNLGGDLRKRIKGCSSDGYYWTFSYPDSLYSNIHYSVLFVPKVVDNVQQHDVGLNLIIRQDTLKTTSYSFGRPFSFVRARYLSTDTLHNVPAIKQGSSIMATFVSDNYEISTDDKELLSSIKALALRYSLPQDSGYEEKIQRDIELTRQYPDSRSLLRCLANFMSYYKSRADVAKIFNHFSEENKLSYFGQKISRYINRVVEEPFNNIVLQTWDSGIEQTIIQDTGKYNLVIFSASWCAPCTKMIPLLKEIYRDLGQELIMTYVSLDENKFAEDWRIKMRTQKIPWRSLMALDKSKDVRNDYIPYIILVHPNNMYWEELDVRKEEDKQRLYELLK